MTTINVIPISAAASYLAFECCLCTMQDTHGMVRERPLYSSVRYCPECKHTVCDKHWMPCNQCYACCWESCLERHWEV